CARRRSTAACRGGRNRRIGGGEDAAALCVQETEKGIRRIPGEKGQAAGAQAETSGRHRARAGGTVGNREEQPDGQSCNGADRQTGQRQHLVSGRQQIV